MSAVSKIQWTDRTWNPVRGCSVVSPGCVNCYAMKQAHRFSGPGRAYEGLTKQTKAGPQWTGKLRTVESALDEPLSWRKPARVFVNSMSDLFHDDVPDEFIDRVFAVMALAPRHTFQILTKRAERMRAYMSALDRAIRLPTETFARWRSEAEQILNDRQDLTTVVTSTWPLPNVWLGVSAEDQQRADERIPLLLQTPAAVRFVSAEPLLGSIDFNRIQLPDAYLQMNGYAGVLPAKADVDAEWDDFKYWQRKALTLDWVIVGGESGPGARPCDVRWILSIVEQCAQARVSCFVKQVGPWLRAVGDKPAGPGFTPWTSDKRMRDRKGGDPSEWPEDLRVREFPRSAVPA